MHLKSLFNVLFLSNIILNVTSSTELLHTQAETQLQAHEELQEQNRLQEQAQFQENMQPQTQLQMARTPQEFIQTLNSINLSQASDADTQSIGNAIASMDTRFIVCVANAAPDTKSIAPIIPLVLDAMSEQEGYLTSNGLKNIANGLRSADVMDTCVRLSGFCPCRTDIENTHYVTKANSIKAENRCKEYLQQYNPALQSSEEIVPENNSNNLMIMEESESNASDIHINDSASNIVMSTLENNPIVENNDISSIMTEQALNTQSRATALQAELLLDQIAPASHEIIHSTEPRAANNNQNRDSIQSNSVDSVAISYTSNYTSNTTSVTSSTSNTTRLYSNQFTSSPITSNISENNTLKSEQTYTQNSKETETTDSYINNSLNNAKSNTISSDSANKETEHKGTETLDTLQTIECNINLSVSSSNVKAEVISMDSISIDSIYLENNSSTNTRKDIIKINLTDNNSVSHSLEIENKTLSQNVEISLLNTELGNSIQNHTKQHNRELVAHNSSTSNREYILSTEDNISADNSSQDIYYSILYQALLMLLTSLISFSLYPSIVYALRVYAAQKYLYSRYYSLLMR